MRFLLTAFISISFFAACKSNKAPDVSHIKIDLSTQRFEKDFFSVDTNQLDGALYKIISQYPAFGENFLTTILNVDPRWTGDTGINYIKGFLSSYRPVFDSSQQVFKDFSEYEKQIEHALQYTKYYFPQYKAPTKIITYIGPLDGYGDILDADLFLIGLHQHLGKNFSLYSSPWVRETYPAYISARFEPGYIPVNCMKNIVLDMYPENLEDKSLVVQMVEKGKRLYLLQRLLPDTKEHMLIGYTEKQWNESVDRQAQIWDLFVQNNFLQSIDYNITKNYIGEGPKTQELGEASPGNIGSFSGWQIVNKYMDKFPETSLPDLMKMDAEQLFQQAKYKP
ncbi:MAG: hypothetical protein EOO06_03075 [Chitinophagaceae bacterium]|nr:MAG: hypothetical protein EOO06_03075 [Chitinophagaceae bacterium]